MMTMRISLLTLALLSVAAAVPVEEQKRDKKAFSLFSIVNFPNIACVPTKTGLTDITGTCYSSTECSAKSGTSSGNCGSGFGVCCTFTIEATTGGTISQNLTVIQNNKFPSTLLVPTTSQTITYTINPVTKDICQLRFDIIAMNLAILTTAGTCTDSLVITSPSGVNPPSICGKNAGLHLYSDVGRSTTATKAVITAAASTTFQKTWRIKISQIECDNPSRAPSGCLQFFTALSGTVQSYNFGNTDTSSNVMLANLDYTTCFRPAKGMCGVILKVDPSVTTPSIAGFHFDTTTTAIVDGACNGGRLTFGGKPHCGQKLNPTTSATANAPVTGGFDYSIHTFANTVTSPATASGFKFIFSQTGTGCP